MPLHFFLGQKDKRGNSGSRKLGIDGTGDGFVIYCRRCHYGLCAHIEIGTCTGGHLNVIFVDPCPVCSGVADPVVIPYPEKYREAARDPRDAIQEDNLR